MSAESKILVTGGCRSGKSAYAMSLIEQAPAKLYVATARATDDEMAERIRRHQADRGPAWRTVEERVELAAALTREARPDEPIVVDCLTTWVANLMVEDESCAESLVLKHVDRLVDAMAGLENRVIFIANEVGTGVVPPYPLGREFRDLAGHVNQRVGRAVDQIILMVAGYPVPVKGEGSPNP